MYSDFIEDLISIVSVVVMVVMVVMMVLMLVVIVVIVVIMMVVVMMFMLVVIIVIVVIVMVVVMMAFTLIIIALVLMLVSCELFVCFFSQLVKFSTESLPGLHYLKHLGATQLIPVSCYDLSLRVKLSDGFNDSVELFTAESLLM